MIQSGNLDMGREFNKKRWRRRILVRGLIIVLVVGALLAGIGIWVARALPGIAAAEISRLTNTRIEMGAFDFHRDASVTINGLVIRPERERPFYDDAILRAKTVRAKFSLGSILLLAPRVTEIRVEDFILDAQYDLDTGQWNIGGLQLNSAPGRGNGAMPTLNLLQGKLRYCRVSGGEMDVTMSVPIEARLGPSETSRQRYSFEVKTGTLAGGYGESYLTGSWQPGHFELAGGLSSTDIPSLERAWAVDVLAADLAYDESGNYEFNLSAKDLHSKHSPEINALELPAPGDLTESVPMAAVQWFFARYRPFGTVAEAVVKASGSLKALSESEVTGRIVCRDVSICNTRFPYAVDHLAGQLDFTKSTMVVNPLSGKHGDVNVCIEGWTRGYGDEKQYQYSITSDNMVLDQDLYAALHPDQKRLWDSFSPSGTVGVDYRLTRSSPTDRDSHIAVELKGVAATYKKFPYPLEGLTGKLVFSPEEIVVSNVTTQGTGRRISLDGKVTARDTDKPLYYILVEADDIPLDEALRRALPPQHRQLYRQFDVNGVADVRARVFTADDANRVSPISFLADVSFENTSLHMEGLPVALSGVSAAASITPESLNIKRSTGHYGQSQVTLTGGLRFAPSGPLQQYHLEIATKETLLDSKIVELLPAPMKEPVSLFRPEGPVNLLVDLQKADVNEPPDYSIVVTCLGNRIDCERFAYPLQDVRGTVTIDTAGVTFKDVTAKPALQSEPGLDPEVQLAGQVSLAPGTRGDGTFAVQGHDLLLTEALGDALPKDVAGIYRDMAPRGPFDLQPTTVRISRAGDDRKEVEFDGGANIRTCSLSVSGTGAELCGALQVKARYDTAYGLSEGRVQLAAERLTIKSKDVTDLNADIIYDPNARSWSARNFLGRCYDGKVLGHLDVSPVEPGVAEYLVTVALCQVNLQPFLLAGKLAQTAEKNYTSGTMDAALSLGSRVGDGTSRLGLCHIDVADMQVGKVSPLANLLAVLSLTEPTDYAFERMLIESYLRRNKLLITKFDMSGKNLAFVGAGSMNLTDGDVNLTLTARGRRVAAAKPSLFQSLTEGLGGAVVRMEVTGKADDPTVETKTLPVIEDSFKILGTPR